MNFISKKIPSDPRKNIREWSSKLRKQNMLLDRQIRSIQREEEKVKISLKQAAKKRDTDVCRILAKEIVNSKKAISRIYGAKAQLNSIQLSLNQQITNFKVSGAIQKSTEVLNKMNKLVKVVEISNTMQELSKEMMKAGIIEEMMEETIDEVVGIDEEEMEEKVAEEVDKVLFEITKGQMGKIPTIEQKALPKINIEEEEREEINEMQKRLEALKS